VPKSHTIFVCQQCGYESSQWMGKCPSCGTWNSLVETLVGGEARSGKREAGSGTAKLQKLSEIKEIGSSRISTGMEEFDRVLGGGIVAGSVTLLAGEPGIGKSTLLLQAAANIAQEVSQVARVPQVPRAKDSRDTRDTSNSRGTSVVYVSGEESPSQIKIRAQRLGIKSENLLFLNETDADSIIDTIQNQKRDPASTLVVVDSIQTLTTEDLTGTAGSVGQVRECTNRLLNMAKSQDIPLFLVGHVTKEGSIAGPMVLSHMVDTVLFFEGERFASLRMLRSMKNRFGPTDEVGVFEMIEKGLNEIDNPSEIFLGERTKEVSGSVITCLMEGTRPLLVEIQALASQTQLPIPRRVGQGIDNNRLQLLVAVLSRRIGLPTGGFDLFVNVAGGIKISEPGADLAICLALASAIMDKPLSQKLCAIGEIGLLGEIRRVGGLEKRIKESKRLGFTKVVSANDSSSLRETVRELLK